jgi:hypothetical protein
MVERRVCTALVPPHPKILYEVNMLEGKTYTLFKLDRLELEARLRINDRIG